MPTYEYACKECNHQFEVFQRMSDDLLENCPECNQVSLKRLIGSGAGLIFKGSGFYETDFKDKKGSAPTKQSETVNTPTSAKKSKEISAAK